MKSQEVFEVCFPIIFCVCVGQVTLTLPPPRLNMVKHVLLYTGTNLYFQNLSDVNRKCF